MIEAISGIFLDKSKALLLQRAAQRTRNPNKWDLVGGDIQEGEDPEEVLLRDAKDKLGVDTVSIRTRGILELMGDPDIVRRHYFVCQGDYSNIVLDLSKYQQFDWCTPSQTYRRKLVPGVKEILTHIKFYKQF